MTVEQGLLTGSSESQGNWEKVKYENLLLFKEKILMALNCLNISKSWCGEKREATPPTPPPPHPTPPSQAEEASGNITNRRQRTFYCIYKFFFFFLLLFHLYDNSSVLARCLSWAPFLECSSLHLFVLRRNPFSPQYQ